MAQSNNKGTEMNKVVAEVRGEFNRKPGSKYFTKPIRNSRKGYKGHNNNKSKSPKKSPKKSKASRITRSLFGRSKKNLKLPNHLVQVKEQKLKKLNVRR